ncbi:helix-turn-helix transcriptional regulator [Streptosporangium amethystogenes subsp. fukuiense]|uniref:Helix-turn-helix transcriptional regulator n=1 Tax=Streptosporangium amethystogenes subsp. fukuiense TaxID=698418 RepID=A0ABW2TAS4_9ACTN
MDDYRSRQLRQFGGRMRELREAAGISGKRLAATAGVTQPTISKIETGKMLPSVEMVTRLAEAIGLDSETREDLLEELTRISTDIATWRRSGGRGEAKQTMLAERERATALRRSFHPAVVPGLLQTAEYARQIFVRSMFLSEEEMSRAVAARMERQTLLYSSDHRFEFLITEAALRVRLGPAAVMRAQLDRLANLSTLTNVRLGIVPWAAELPRVALHGFAIFDEQRVAVETYTSELTLTDSRDVETYVRLFEDLSTVALFDDDARTILGQLAE